MQGKNKTTNGLPQRFTTSLIGFFTILLVVFGILTYFWLEKEVTLVADGSEQTFRSFSASVGSLLEKKGIELADGDVVVPELSARLSNGDIVTVTRAVDIKVIADGATQVIHSVPLTAGDLLAQTGITLGELDRTSIALDALVDGSAPLTVSRITTKKVDIRREIAPPVEHREDNTLEKGIVKVLQKGKSGVAVDTVYLQYADGVEISRQTIATKVVTEPVKKVIANGTITVASRGGQSFNFSSAKVVKAYAYTATNGRTATGMKAAVGVIAVDPSVIPLRSRVYVEGYGFAVAGDTGGNIKGDTIDVFLETESACRSWGVKYVKIYVLD